MAKPVSKIQELFLGGPPPTPEEVRRIVLSEPPESASDDLVALMERDMLLQHHFGLFLEVAKLLDISNRRQDAMMRVVKNKQQSSLSRQFALLGMTSCQPQDVMMDIFQDVDPAIITATSDMPFVDMLTAIQLDPTLACDLTNVLLGASEEEQEFILLHHVGRIRREVGTPASLAYAHALAEPSLGHLHHHMIDALIAERDSSAVKLLTDLRDHAPNDDMRRRFQAALLRIGTLQIEDQPGRNTPEARAFVSICDGQGAYFLFCRYRMSESNFATASCCIRTAADIRDAFVLPGQSEEEFQEMLHHLAEQRLIYTEVPLGHAAMLFSDALNRTRELDKKLPESAVPVIHLFERIDPDFPDEVEPKKTVTAAALQALMAGPHYDTWFFDEGDLVGHGVASPEGLPTAKWFQAAGEALEKTPLKARVVSMLDHMAKWHTWAGEPRSAALLTAAKNQAESNFKKSAALRVMLERSLYDGDPDDPFAALADELATEEEPFGSESLRGTLRRRFFNELRRPAGLHLAELDFMEAAYHQLHLAFSGLPGEKRPREDDVLDLSAEVAREFVRSLLNGRAATSMVEKLDKTVSRYSDLSGTERADLIHVVVEGLFGFMDAACKKCGVQCLDSPRKGMADAFFSSKHPATE